MADTKLKFEIGSVFSGEGFAQATRAVDNASKGVQKAASGMAQLGGELGQLNGTVGKVAGGLSNLLGSLAMGPWGVAAAAVGMVVGALVKWKNSMDEARKAHEDLMAKMQEGYQRRLAKYADDARKKAISALEASINLGNAAIQRIDKLAGAYQRLGQAEDGARKAGERIQLAAIELQGQGYAAGMDPRQAAISNAETALEKAKVQNASRLEDQNREVANATEEVRNLAEKMRLTRQVISDMAKAGKDTTKEQDSLRLMGIDLAAAQKKLKTAEDNLTAVKLENEATEQKMVDAVNQALAAQADYNEQLKKAAEAKKLEAKAAEDVAKREKEGQAAVAKIDRQIAAEKKRIAETEKVRAANQGGMAADRRSHNGLFGGYEYKLDANGNISDFEDFQRAQRYARGRGANDARNADAHNVATQRQMDRIQDRIDRGKSVSKAERQRLDQWNEFRRQRQTKEQEEARLKALQAKRDEIQKKVQQDVAQIRKELAAALRVN